MELELKERIDRINKFIAQEELKESLKNSHEIFSRYNVALLSGDTATIEKLFPSIQHIRKLHMAAMEDDDNITLSADLERSISRMRAIIAPEPAKTSTDHALHSFQEPSGRGRPGRRGESPYTMRDTGQRDHFIPAGDAAALGIKPEQGEDAALTRMKKYLIEDRNFG
jgi:hypothetical protein